MAQQHTSPQEVLGAAEGPDAESPAADAEADAEPPSPGGVLAAPSRPGARRC